MAIAVVQIKGNWNNYVSSLATTITASTAGNTIVAFIGNRSTGAVSSITDNKGQTWTQVPGVAASCSDGACDMWYVDNTVSGVTSVTVTYASPQYPSLEVYELSGTAGSSIVDVSGTISNQSASATPVSPSLTTTVSGDIIIAGFGSESADSGSVSSPYTLSNVGVIQSAYYITSGTVSGSACTFNQGTAYAWCALAVAFKPVPVGSTATWSGSASFTPAAEYNSPAYATWVSTATFTPKPPAGPSTSAAIILQKKARWKPPLGTSLNPSHTLSQGLAAAYLFNENGGTTVYNAVNGISSAFSSTNLTWSQGQFGPCLTTNGSTAYIDTPLAFSGGIGTIAFWALGNTASGIYPSWVNSAATDNLEFGYISSSNQIFYKASGYFANTYTQPGDGKWHHYALTSNGTTASFYIDGQFKESLSYAFPTDLMSILKGYSPTPSGNKIDQVLFYSRNISAGEVRQLYADPFCFMRPQRIFIPLEASSGGGSIATWSPSASLANIGSALADSATTFTGSASFTPKGNALIPAQATWTGASSLTITGATVISGNVTWTGAAALVIDGESNADTVATYAPSGNLSAVGASLFQSKATWSSSAALVVDGAALTESDLTIGAAASFDAAGIAAMIGTATWTGSISFAAASPSSSGSDLTINAATALSADGAAIANGIAAWTPDATFSTDGRALIGTVLDIAAGNTLVLDGAAKTKSAITIAPGAALVVDGTGLQKSALTVAPAVSLSLVADALADGYYDIAALCAASFIGGSLAAADFDVPASSVIAFIGSSLAASSLDVEMVFAWDVIGRRIVFAPIDATRIITLAPGEKILDPRAISRTISAAAASKILTPDGEIRILNPTNKGRTL